MGWEDDSDWFGLGSLGALLASPAVQYIASWFASEEQGQAQEEYEARTDEQIEAAIQQAEERERTGLALYQRQMQPGLDELLGLQERIMGAPGEMGEIEELRARTGISGVNFIEDFETRAEELMTGYRGGQASFLEELGGRGQNIREGYGGRYSYAQGQLDQLGGQQRADINRLFDEEQARVTLDLQQRGLLSSTEAARGGYDVAERRSAELRRFEEGLTRERIDVLSGLSGEQLSAEERLLGQRTAYEYGGLQTGFGAQAGLDAAQADYERAVRGDILGARQDVLNYDMATSGTLADFYGGRAANMSNLYMQGSGDLLNTLMGINFQPPQGGQSFTFGQNAVQPVQPPSGGTGGWLSGGLGGALMLLALL